MQYVFACRTRKGVEEVAATKETINFEPKTRPKMLKNEDEFDF